MEIDKIKEMLEYRFSLTTELPQKRHIIFWYDSKKEFKDLMDDLNLTDVKIIKLTKSVDKKGEAIYTNIFKTKYTLEVIDTESNYLIYSEYPRVIDSENYLLDIEKYSEFFEADKSAMIVEELKLDRTNYRFGEIIREYSSFFANKERREKLIKLIENPESLDDEKFKLSILTVISGAKTVDILEILKNIILNRNKLQDIEKWMNLEFLFSEIKKKFDIEVTSFEQFLKILMVTHFYFELGKKPHTNLENYFKGRKNELYIFADSLLQNKQTSEIIRKEFYELAKDLNIKDKIDELELDYSIKGTAFEYFDKIIIKDIIEIFNSEIIDYDKYKKYIEIRLDNSLWREEYQHFYNALLAVNDFFRIKDSLIIEDREELREIFKDYTKNYFLIDKLYRDFYYSYDKIKNSELAPLFDTLKSKINKFYEIDYLEKLLALWSSKVYEREKLPQQKDFYKNNIVKADVRTVVIISDALRYEVGYEISQKLRKEANVKEIKIEAMLTDLPSRTFLGMANLLPCKKERDIDLVSAKVLIDGIDSQGTENREKILKASREESSAISFDNFYKMNRAKQEEFIKGKKVIYIYHDSIDAIGDKGKTENNTFNACKDAVENIVSLSKLLSSLGVVNIYITSDHGFLYEKKEVEEYNKLELKNTKYKSIGKRYAIYEKEVEEKGCVTLKLDSLYGVFPEKNQRIKASGSGLQFVHGGASPQEMIIPLINYKSGANSKKISKVQVRIRESVAKITSNLTKFSIYQIEAVSIKDKFIERDVSVALYDGDVRVSDEKKLKLNSIEENTIHDFRLTLSGEHKRVTLKVIDIESGDILDSKEYDVSIGIASDFDF
ncbi:TIGR02687 family protein [Fusobacterium animalis]|uniref:TIGR02687 family protein n=2 Tax=Fusobacterium animalis TaxID=76859 RepID=A0A140PQL9_9FUSO|nr:MULTISPECIES: BREX-1 system phosphatase PglZ type A [Fusobacterium]ASG31323.1 TIGR02687 family protein [Fusobacterium animalis]EEO42028.1 TIGR02687 family protein [Fusobacterium animalis 7_1]EGN63150.1 putative DNA repair protein [Fusobacterium animalis 11_3_2]EPC08014.1 TIGR02687 family protein [Fusobacterium polymorphum F0401]ERT41082.1 TIGR02687 family protein [Fusobacterium nucleatum CTI-1]